MRVGVVGCGLMGAGFAEVCARAGLDVVVLVPSVESAARGRGRVLASLERGVRKGKVSAEEKDRAIARLSFTTDVGLLADREFLLEAVGESAAEKVEVFKRLDSVVVDPGAVLASTTSSVSIAVLGAATDDPGRVVGAHFFNPVTVMSLVELVVGPGSSERVVGRAREFLGGVLGKSVVETADTPGFVVNALLVPYLLAAVRMVEAGVASAVDVDRGMVLGCGHPMGPLALVDLIGLDTVAAIGRSVYEETGDGVWEPPGLLLRMVEGGELGRKAGVGFHRYG